MPGFLQMAQREHAIQNNNGTKCSDIATWTTVAQSGKASTAMTLTGTKLNLYTKDGAVII